MFYRGEYRQAARERDLHRGRADQLGQDLVAEQDARRDERARFEAARALARDEFERLRGYVRACNAPELLADRIDDALRRLSMPQGAERAGGAGDDDGGPDDPPAAGGARILPLRPRPDEPDTTPERRKG